MPFSGKRIDFVKIHSNSSDSNIFRGSNLRQNPTKSVFRGDFCIMTKMCLGANFKSVHTCVHTPTCPRIQSEDTLYTRRPGIQSEDKSVYNTFKVRTFFHTPLNMPGTYKERITSIPHYTHIMEE